MLQNKRFVATQTFNHKWLFCRVLEKAKILRYRWDYINAIYIKFIKVLMKKKDKFELLMCLTSRLHYAALMTCCWPMRKKS